MEPRRRRGRCGAPPLLRCLAAAALCARAAALPSYLTGCEHPTHAMGPHGAPIDDSAVTFALHDAAGVAVTAFQPGGVYTLTVTPTLPSRGMLTVTGGALMESRQCDGRRANWLTVDTPLRATWTAPSAADAPTVFAVTLSSGTEYHAARLSIGAGPVPAARGSMDMAGSSSSSEGGYVAEMHVGTLHVDALDAHAHMGGGGSWAGHAIPASFFLIWGSYWALSAIAAVAAAGATRTPFRVRAWYPFLPRTLPRAWSRLRRLEPILKVALPSFGAFCELYFHPKFGGSRGGSQFNGMHNPDGTFNEGHAKFWQHACMYGFFILSGAVDLRDARLLPPMSGHAVLSGAFFAEAFLFYFHLQSQSGMLQEIHLLLVYAIVMCGVATAAEALTGSGVAALARAYFTLLQGSWFAQITHAIYGKKPWVEDMATEMMMPVYFCLHLLLWAGALLTLNGLWARYEHGTVLAARGGALWQTLEAAALAGSANGAGDSCAPSSV